MNTARKAHAKSRNVSNIFLFALESAAGCSHLCWCSGSIPALFTARMPRAWFLPLVFGERLSKKQFDKENVE